MASTYTPLGIEKQATGENAGTWGTKTNTNLEIIEQISGGYTAVNFASDANKALSVSDGSTGAELAHRVLEFTSSGSLTATRDCTIPLDVQNFYFLKNSTTGSQSIRFKYVSGTDTGVTVANGKTVIAYAKANDSTNPGIDSISLASDLVDDTTPQLGGNLDTNSFMIDFDDAHGIRDENGNEQLIFETTSSAVNHIDITNAATGAGAQIGAVGGDSNLNLRLRPKGTGVIEAMGADNPGSIQLNCENNSHGIKLTSPPHSSGQSYELKFPTGNVTADRFLKVDSITGSGATAVGQLSFGEVSGGTSWQAVKTSTFTAVAGEGYFINTTAGAIEMDLPAGNIGDEVSFIDYAGTFDTNALTIDQNGSEKIAGSTDPLTVSTERAANTLVYVDSTQGWLLKNN
jgi:hypothetical protein